MNLTKLKDALTRAQATVDTLRVALADAINAIDEPEEVPPTEDPPIIIGFHADRAWYAPGQPFFLSWQVTPEDAVVQVSIGSAGWGDAPVAADNVGWTPDPYPAPGAHVITIIAITEAGMATETTTVNVEGPVSPPPPVQVLDFTMTPDPTKVPVSIDEPILFEAVFKEMVEEATKELNGGSGGAV